MKLKLFFLTMLVFLQLRSITQTLGYPFVQTVSASSVTAYSSSHSVIEYSLPANAIGYIVRFITKSKGVDFDEPSLSSLLAVLPKSELTQAAALAQYALGNSDDNNVDFYVMTTKKDADNFEGGGLFYFYNAKVLRRTVSACFFDDDCLNNTIYFGIENHNYFKGVNVRVEIIPVYGNNSSSENAHNFTLQVHNETGTDLKFEIQNDNDPNWYPVSLSSGSYTNVKVSSPEVHIRIATDGIYKVRVASTLERQWLRWDKDKKIWDIKYD